MLFEPLNFGVSSNKHLALYPAHCKCSKNSNFKKERERTSLIKEMVNREEKRRDMSRVARGQVGSLGRGEGGTDRDGEEPPGHLYHGGIAEVAGKERDVDGGGHEDDLEVRSLGQQAPEDTQEEVVVEVPLVDFIHDQDLVLWQAGLPLDLPQEQPHCQEHDLGGRRACALETDLVADLGVGGSGSVWSGEHLGLGHSPSPSPN